MNMPARFMSRFFLLSCLLLWTATPGLCADKADEAAFKALGLLADPQERAEDILLRAHAGDTFALALAVVGYDLGVHGFPQDSNLARVMATMASYWGAPRMESFLHAFWWRSTRSEDMLSALLCFCKGGAGSPLVERFKIAGLFDLQAMLAELARQYEKTSPETKAAHEQLMQSYWFRVESIEASTKRYRTLTPKSDEEAEQQLKEQRTGKFSAAGILQSLFWAATSHDPERERPDWDTERLLDIVRQRRENRDYIWFATATDVLNSWLLADQEMNRELIRRAHQGEIPAMRAMARNYVAGENAFPEEVFLSRCWLERAALQGDALSMAALAGCEYDAGHIGSAFAWALLAQENGVAETVKMAAWLQKRCEERLSPEDKKEAQALLKKYREQMRTSEASGQMRQAD